MRKPLQDHKNSQYERPHQPWLCGMAAEGLGCPVGTEGRGKCPLADHCLPVQESDRWKCGTPVFSTGQCSHGPNPNGTCHGPLKCQVVPSLRIVRGRLIAACLVFTLGLLLVVFHAQWRNEVIAPGPLSQSHAQIVHRENPTQRCATCHPSGNASLWDWCQWSKLTGVASGPTQSELCLKCHEKLIPTAVALSPHSIPPEVLQVKTRALFAESQAPKRAGLDLSVGTKRHALECSACHREHHGNSPGLSAMTDAQCQTCHQRTFHNFAAGHPEFENWPNEQPGRLAFNHAVHAGKHFAAAKQEFACNLCHVDDPQKNTKLLASFEQTCAKCHQGKILASTQEGIPFLSLPTLDVAAIRKAGHALPPWPAANDGDFDGRLPWPMRLLLSTDAEAAAALPVLGDDSDFANLQSNRPDHLRSAAAIARGIERLWQELATRGNEAVEERLSRLSSARQANLSLTQGLGPETLSTVSGWLGLRPQPQAQRTTNNPIALAFFADDPITTLKPDNPLRGKAIEDDNDSLDSLTTPVQPDRSANVPQPPRLLATLPAGPRGVWLADSATFTLRFFPRGHADATLAAWLDVAAAPAFGSQAWKSQQVFNSKSQGLCLQCHQLTEVDHIQQLSWKRNLPPRRGFTKFSHRPHLIQPQLADCTHCHRMNNSGPQYVDLQPGQLPAHDFAPLQKVACVQCHQQSAAGNGCTQCHRYHVESQALR